MKYVYCPCCGKPGGVEHIGAGFVEVGEYDGKTYEEEGNVDRYRCANCETEFFGGLND